MRIETGHPVTNNVAAIDATEVRFVTDDGATMFAVKIVSDNAIEVRVVDNCAVDGVLYANRLDIRPDTANMVTILVPRYDSAY